MSTINRDAFTESELNKFRDELESFIDFIDDDEQILNMLQAGAELLVNEIRKLPRPRSKLSGSNYTHLLDSVDYWVTDDKKAIHAGWTKYYGPMVERGARHMNNAQPHFRPTFNRYELAIFRAMINYANRQIGE